MPKSVTTDMQTHLDGEVTTLCTIWRVTRTDGVEFFFTDHDTAIVYEGNKYEADSGYQRTAVQNDSSLAVDNLDIEGILNSDQITEQDLRAGKFDYAEVRVAMVNWANLAHGEIKLRRGLLGQVTLTERGIFKAELRGLTQQLSQRVGEIFQPECRADLGDSRCRFPIEPPVRVNETAYALGSFVRVATNGNGDLSPSVRLFVSGDTDENDESPYAAVATVGAGASQSAAQSKFGGGSIEFTAAGATNPSTSFVSFADSNNYALGGDDFTIDFWARFDLLSATTQVFISKHTNTGNQREWYIRRNGTNLEFWASNNGTDQLVALTASTAWAINTWYHIAVTRVDNLWSLYLDGALVAQTTVAGSVYNSTSPIYLGKYVNTSASDAPFDGYLDDVRIYIGEALYKKSFAPPTSTVGVLAETQQSAYENRIYECTTAGTSASTLPTFDTTVGNTTTDGTAVWTAREAFTRHAWIDAVTDRENFTLYSFNYAGNGDVDEWYDGGVLTFESGDNKGRSIEVKNWTQATRAIQLFLQSSYAIKRGTAIKLYPGCDKRAETCRDKFRIGSTLFTTGNIKNFRGEPHLPGPDAAGDYPDAK